MAGYSGKTLVQKLGIKPGWNLYFYNEPADYDKLLYDLPPVTIYKSTAHRLNFIQIFVTSFKELEKCFSKMMVHLEKDGMLWVSWPKKSSGIQSNLNENIIRDLGLKKGMVDVKVIAVDEKWSALKFVFRLKYR